MLETLEKQVQKVQFLVFSQGRTENVETSWLIYSSERLRIDPRSLSDSLERWVATYPLAI